MSNVPDRAPLVAPCLEQFPAPVYTDTVLDPLFETVKRHHWRQLMRVHRAHAIMLSEQNLLNRADTAALLKTLDAVEHDCASRLDAIRFTGAHEDFYFFVDAELRSRLGPAIPGRLHTGRSRNDIDQTLLKMALRGRLLAVLATLAEVLDALLDAAERERHSLIVAYTHAQPAQPTTWGHILAAMTEMLVRDADRLRAALTTVDQCSMGAAAITTTGFPIDRARVAELLGFSRIQENAYGAVAACDYATGTYAAIQVLLINLGRVVQQLSFWTAFEVGQLHVPDAFVQRSSIMPQKRNPVPIEHLRLTCSLGIGYADAVLLAMHNTPFTDVNDNDYAVHETGYAALDAAGRALRLFGSFVAALRVDERRVKQDIEAAGITLTELADSLVRVEGIPFAEAHRVCARVAEHLVANRTTLDAVPFDVFRDAFAAAIGRAPKLVEGDFRRFVTPEHFIAVRTRPGGPAPAALAQSIASHRASAAQLRTDLAAYDDRLARSTRLLDAAVATFR